MAEPPFDAFRYAHARRGEVVWMSQNTNHLVPPEVVQGALFEAIRERRYEGYPYAPGHDRLKELVARDLGLPPEVGVSVSAGGTETLYMAMRALLKPGDEVIASDPSYLIIHRFIELSGARTVNLDIYRPPFRLTAERVREAVTDRTRMILLIDPLNPLGSGYPEDEVRAIAEVARERDLYLLNDVTYRDFAEHPTLAYPFAPDQTLTVWSVSKNCGLAGLRLGGLAASKTTLSKVLRFNTNDLGVNELAQVAAEAALESKPRWFPEVKRQTRANQERIRGVVRDLPGVSLPLFPSQANMFVLDVAEAGIGPEALQRELLLHHGVFVRAGNYLSPGYGERFVRVSFSNPPSDLDRFVEAFPAAVHALGPATVKAPAAG
jgi:aspartate aminotransferase